MGAITGLLGIGGGQSGTGINAPTLAPVQQGVTQEQIAGSYGQNQQALQQQQALLSALQGQGGLQNQRNIYGQLQGIANGTGPNPAQAALAQNTAANVAQTGALMAGQRGASQNVGLLARQAGQQGAQTQQNAVGQAATLQAEQAQNAINAMSGIANSQVANQIGATGAVTQANQAQYGNLLNALGGFNSANVSNQSGVNAANAGLANTQLQGQQGMIGGLLNSIGGGAAKAHGGVIGYDEGGTVQGPQSSFGQFLSGVQQGSAPAIASPSFTSDPAAKTLQEGVAKAVPNYKDISGSVTGGGSPAGAIAGGQGEGMGSMAMLLAADGGKVPVMLSPGEKVLSPTEAKQVANGGRVAGKTVPGKAEVKGDSLKNDKVPAKLPPGTIIVPRTKVKSPTSFVQATLAKKRGKK